MSRLRTINVHGHTYFVTTKVWHDMPIFVSDAYCRIILDNLRFYSKSKKFDVIGYVIMPNHLHYIIWPESKYFISNILRDFKKHTAKQIIEQLKYDKREGRIQNPAYQLPRGIPNPASSEWTKTMLNTFYLNSSKQEFRVWQPNNWVENIYSERFLEQKLNYIHDNPVRAGFVINPEDFPYSSAFDSFL